MPEPGFLRAVEVLTDALLTPQEFARHKPAANQMEMKWITVHPHGEGEEGRRIQINTKTGEIEKGFGAGKTMHEAFSPKSESPSETPKPAEEFKSPFHGDEESRHWYGANNRPIGHATVPRGFVETKNHDAFRHGAVAYPQPLSEKDQYDYELTPIHGDDAIPELAKKLGGEMDKYASQYADPENDSILDDFLGQEKSRKLLGHVDKDKLKAEFRKQFGQHEEEAAPEPQKPEDAILSKYPSLAEPPKQAEMSEMVRAAAGYQLHGMRNEPDDRAAWREHSQHMTKSAIDGWLMKKFGIDSATARAVSNAAGEMNPFTTEGAGTVGGQGVKWNHNTPEPTMEELGDMPWMKSGADESPALPPEIAAKYPSLAETPKASEPASQESPDSRFASAIHDGRVDDAMAVLSKLPHKQAEKIAGDLGMPVYNSKTKKGLLESVRKIAENNTPEKREARSKRESIQSANADAKRALDNADAHALGRMGAPLDQGLSDEQVRDPHSDDHRHAVQAAWSKKVADAFSKLDKSDPTAQALIAKAKHLGIYDADKKSPEAAIAEKYPSLAESEPDPSKMSLADKLAWQKANPGKGKIKSPEVKPRPKQMASVSGAKYEFVKDNGDGTATVRNEQGDEFSTDPGEPWSLDAPEKSGQVSLAEPKAVAWKGHLDEKPLGYKQFIAAGNNDRDWEAYSGEVNARSREKHQSAFISKWKSGEKLNGNDVAMHLKNRGVELPPDVSRALQDDDTTITATSVSGRGMSKSEAAKIHRAVNGAMTNLHGVADAGQVSPSPEKSAQEPWQMRRDDFVDSELDKAANDPSHPEYAVMKSMSSAGKFPKWKDDLRKKLSSQWDQSRDNAISAGKLNSDQPGLTEGTKKRWSAFVAKEFGGNESKAKSQGWEPEDFSDEPAPMPSEKENADGIRAAAIVGAKDTLASLKKKNVNGSKDNDIKSLLSYFPSLAEPESPSPKESVDDRKPFKPEGVPGEQMGLFNQDAGGQKSLFNVVKPDKKSKKTSVAAPSELEKIGDEHKSRSESAPLPGQKSMSGLAEKPKSISEADGRIASQKMASDFLQESRDEKDQAQRKAKVSQWRSGFTGSPKENNASGDIARHDWEKALQNGVSPKRLSEMVDSAVQAGALDAGVGKHLKSRFSIEDQYPSLKGYAGEGSKPLYAPSDEKTKAGEEYRTALAGAGKFHASRVAAAEAGVKAGHTLDEMLQDLKDEGVHEFDAKRIIGDAFDKAGKPVTRSDQPKPRPSDGDWKPENHVKIAADDISKLRKQDVYRLMENATGDRRAKMADYIRQNRPELAEEVQDSLDDLGGDSTASEPAKAAESKPKAKSKPVKFEMPTDEQLAGMSPKRHPKAGYYLTHLDSALDDLQTARKNLAEAKKPQSGYYPSLLAKAEAENKKAERAYKKEFLKAQEQSEKYEEFSRRAPHEELIHHLHEAMNHDGRCCYEKEEGEDDIADHVPSDHRHMDKAVHELCRHLGASHPELQAAYENYTAAME